MRARIEVRKSVLRVVLYAATAFSAGLAFMPLAQGGQFGDPPVYPWSLKATYHWDLPYGNCCVIKYKGGYTYSNPPECTRCHIQPSDAENWEDWSVPEEYAGEACLRFDGG
jgi:hypothetical protein